MRNARVTMLVSGGSAASRLRLVEALHAIGRTAGSPLISLAEHTGRQAMLVRILAGDTRSITPSTIFVDCADCLNPETVRLLVGAADAIDDHWLAEPGRTDGIRLILGARDPSRLAPALAVRTSAAHMAADASTLVAAAAEGATTFPLP